MELGVMFNKVQGKAARFALCLPSVTQMKRKAPRESFETHGLRKAP
jgi:hypothetical protein